MTARAIVWSEANVLGTITWVLAVWVVPGDGGCVVSMLGSDVQGLLGGDVLHAGSYVNLDAAAFTGRQVLETIDRVH